jgi:hypothetical protein
LRTGTRMPDPISATTSRVVSPRSAHRCPSLRRWRRSSCRRTAIFDSRCPESSGARRTRVLRPLSTPGRRHGTLRRPRWPRRLLRRSPRSPWPDEVRRVAFRRRSVAKERPRSSILEPAARGAAGEERGVA